MDRPFNDELLSAYLDGQLAGEELALVEAELAASSHARQLLDELRSISREVRELPRHTAGPEFAERVVQAALAAKAAELNGQGQVERPAAARDGSRDKTRRGVRLPLVLAGAAALAAALAMMVWPWLGGGLGPGPIPADPGTITEAPLSAAEAALAQLRQAVPQEGEAVVIRLRLGADGAAAQVLDQALTAAGIEYRGADDQTTGAMQFAAEYRRQLADKFGGVQPGVPNPDLLEGTVAAADAVFVEASWEVLEKAIGSLAAGPQGAIDVCPLTRVAAAAPAGSDTAVGEGEGGSRTKSAAVAASNFAQRLNASVLRLEKAAQQLAPAATAAPLDPQRPLRVLILVEPAP
jgi:hypothetical protein